MNDKYQARFWELNFETKASFSSRLKLPHTFSTDNDRTRHNNYKFLSFINLFVQDLDLYQQDLLAIIILARFVSSCQVGTNYIAQEADHF